MLLEEAQARLKKTEITQEQLKGLNSLFMLLDLCEDDFCKIIDTVGLETLLEKQNHYDWLDKVRRGVDDLKKIVDYSYVASQEICNNLHLLVEFADGDEILTAMACYDYGLAQGKRQERAKRRLQTPISVNPEVRQ